MPQVQVELQTGRTIELRQCRIDVNWLSSVGVKAGMHIQAKDPPVSLVRTDLLGDSQAVVSVEESTHTNLLPVQSDVQTIGMMGIRQARIYPSLLGSVGVPTGLTIGEGFFLASLVTADLLGNR